MGARAKLSIDSDIVRERHGPITVGVDPGEDTGIAALHDGRVFMVAAVSYSDVDVMQQIRTALQPFDDIEIVWEKPQVYQFSKVSPSSLITTAFRAGIVIGAIRERKSQTWTQAVLPREWKGQVPKPVHNQRVLKDMTDRERKLVENAGFSKKQLDDVIDSIGLAKWAAFDCTRGSK